MIKRMFYSQKDKPGMEEDETLILEPCPIWVEELSVALVAASGCDRRANTHSD